MRKSDIKKITDIEDETYMDLVETCKMYNLTLCEVLEYIDNDKFYLHESVFKGAIHYTLFFHKYFIDFQVSGVCGTISIDEVTEVEYE